MEFAWVGVIVSGIFPGESNPGREFLSGWILSWVGIVRVEVIVGGNFPGGNYTGGSYPG